MVAAAYRGAMTRTAHAGERTFVDAIELGSTGRPTGAGSGVTTQIVARSAR